MPWQVAVAAKTERGGVEAGQSAAVGEESGRTEDAPGKGEIGTDEQGERLVARTDLR